MKTIRIFWVLVAVVVIFGVSALVARLKLNELKNPSTQIDKVVVVDAPPGNSPRSQGAPGGPGANSETSAGPTTPTAAGGGAVTTAVTGVVDGANSTVTPAENSGPCIDQSEYREMHSQLGRLVNQEDLREHHVHEFLKAINEFRSKYGLPLPLGISSNKFESDQVVFNKCKSSCKGKVNQVFVSQLVDGRYLEVLTKDGGLKKLPIHDSGLEVATIDELNGKGVPFRSWNVPITDTDWYVLGNNIYYALDIEGLWLKVDLKSHWDVVTKPEGLKRLVSVEPQFKIEGCTEDDQCLQTEETKEGAGGRTGARHFKAPKACAPIVSHASDEVADHPSPTPATAKQVMKKGMKKRIEDPGSYQ